MENIKLFCVSLGCDKNLVDTEKMLGLLNGQGIIFTDDETEADVILINTCCFIGDAKEESVNTILEMARYKEEGNLKALLVAGCLAQRYKQEILDEIPEVDAILAKGLKGEAVTKEEELKFKTAFMLFVAREYNAMEWIMQIHYGCKRDNNGYMFEKLGADTGFDCINNYAPSAQMADFLNALSTNNEIPKTILYSLNPNDNASIGTIIGCFQEKFPGKIQQGSAWWFNDHKTGMTEQMTSLANLGCLGNFIGMLTDSRSFLSYTRHEYFRRILCSLVGGWVENGEYPADMKALEEIVKGICYNNAVKYFGFKLDEVK